MNHARVNCILWAILIPNLHSQFVNLKCKWAKLPLKEESQWHFVCETKLIKLVNVLNLMRIPPLHQVAICCWRLLPLPIYFSPPLETPTFWGWWYCFQRKSWSLTFKFIRRQHIYPHLGSLIPSTLHASSVRVNQVKFYTRPYMHT